MTQTTDLMPVRRALISVSDKSGLGDLGSRLAAAGVELVSTGEPHGRCATPLLPSAMLPN